MDSINDIVRRLRENRILQERKDYKSYPRDELIKMAQEGDQLAFDTLVQTHKDFIEMMSYKYFADGADREDIIQLATIAFWKAVSQWNMRGNFEAFAGRMIKNDLIDEIRKAEANKNQINVHAQSTEDTINSDGEGGEQTLGDTLASDDDSVEDQVYTRELLRVIEEFLVNEYSQEERDILRKSVEGYKPKEIAEVMGVTHKRVDNVLYKVRYHLKEFLRKNSYRESKSVSMNEEIEFSEEEKQLLLQALDNIKMRENRRFKADRLKEAFANYTEEQLEKVLDDMEVELEDIIYDLRSTDPDDRTDSLEQLEDMHIKLMSLEDYIDTEAMQEKYDDLQDAIKRAEDTEYDGPTKRRDPYAERGLSRSDFY